MKLFDVTFQDSYIDFSSHSDYLLARTLDVLEMFGLVSFHRMMLSLKDGQMELAMSSRPRTPR